MALSITIADDSVLSRKNVRKALPPEWEVQITEAVNGQEAIRAVEAGQADVLFLDLTMPVMDGFAVLQYLHDQHRKVVVIVISADIQPQAQALVHSLGAFCFLPKPLQPQSLRAALTELGLL